MPVQTRPRVPALMNIATRLRIDSVLSTTAAGSGHPSSCCSAAEIMAALFFSEMRYDPRDPNNPDNDRFVLSKGHAAPVLYAAWAEAGICTREDLMSLRKLASDFEGHPTPRLPWVDVATGSLGQGLCAGVGIALLTRSLSRSAPYWVGAVAGIAGALILTWLFTRTSAGVSTTMRPVRWSGRAVVDEARRSRCVGGPDPP